MISKNNFTLNPKKTYYLLRAAHREDLLVALARPDSSSNSYTTDQEIGTDTTFATDEEIQVEMCFIHPALEYLIIVVFTEGIFICAVK